MTRRGAMLVLCLTTTLTGCSAASVVARTNATRPAGSHSATLAHRASAPRPGGLTSAAAVPTAKPTTKQPPKPSACAANTDAQLVLVSVARQHVWMCARSHLVYDSPVTTGAVDVPYDSTPLGTYRIQTRQTDTTLTLLNGAQYQVKYWVTFDAPLFGFHDSSWQRFAYGSPRYRTEGSHGCIHMPLTAMKFLYDWAGIGATVTIRA